MKVSKELLNHIEAANLKTKAWVAEDPNNRWAGLYPTDVRHWEDRGIFTMAQLEREELITHIYEGHKDAYGTKGRHYDFDAMSLEQLKAEADSISSAIASEMERMEAQERASIAKFENQIADLKKMGASREDAIRWMLDAEGLKDEYDVGYVQYTFGLPYSYKNEEFTAALKVA